MFMTTTSNAGSTTLFNLTAQQAHIFGYVVSVKLCIGHRSKFLNLHKRSNSNKTLQKESSPLRKKNQMSH